MGVELVTGLCVTSNAATNPLETFVWDAQGSGDTLNVTVGYGRVTQNDNLATGEIEWGSLTPVPMIPSPGQSNRAITVNGTVQAHWLGTNSYVITFSGRMMRPNLVNITSSDQNGVAADGAAIIVAAYLASEVEV